MLGFADVVVGVQWGDEGKARVIDQLISEYNINARYNGGPNAGHTLVVGGQKIVLHQIPSGVFSPNTLLYDGSGCVINPVKLLDEIRQVQSVGLSLDDRFFISDQATLIAPHHLFIDELAGKELGTTGNGIGPAYADRALRSERALLKNLRLGDVLDNFPEARRIMQGNLQWAQQVYGVKTQSVGGIEAVLEAIERLQPYIQRDTLWLESLVRQGQNVLFEGAQAAMLDVNKGTVPFVTSSHTVAGAAFVGGDLPPHYHRKTIGVAKAIASRVGYGPFVSEFGGRKSEEYCMAEQGRLHNKEYEQAHYVIDDLLQSTDFFEVGIGLRMRGDEYGATTKRPRRIGMLDLVQLQYACRLNGVQELYLNKVDCLADFQRVGMPGIPVVHAYTIDGKTVVSMPGTTAMLYRAEPVIHYLSHLQVGVLDGASQEFIQVLEGVTGAKLKALGIGPERNQLWEL